MELNYIAIGVAAVAQFIFGAIWYMPLFGRLWGRIHGFDTQPPEAQEAMKKAMFPLLLVQFIITLVTTVVFAILAGGLPAAWNLFGLGVFFWLGFIVPTQVAAVIFGGTDPKWIVKKTLVMAGASFFCMQIIAATLYLLA